MRYVLFALVLAGALQDPPKKPDTRLVVSLDDGTRLLARLEGESVTISTAYGEQRIPAADLQSLRRVDGATFRAVTAKVTCEGAIQQKSFTLETDLGKISVPVTDLKGMAPGRNASIFTDENTVAFWSFEEARDGRVADAAGAHGMTVNGADIASEADGPSAFVRQNEQSYAEAAWDGETGFTSGAFTLESRFKLGRVTKSYGVLLAKHDRANCYLRDFWLLAQNNGSLYFDSGSQNANMFSSQTPAGLFKQDEWTYLALVYNPKGPVFLTFYLNGKQVHVDRRPPRFGTSTGPLTIGPGPSAAQHFSCPERVQFARISRAARSAEEIAECQKVFESGATLLWRGRNRGVSPRSGGFIAAKVPGLAGKSFKTAYGTLVIDAKAAGQVQLYAIRERDLPALQSQVDTLIGTLGAGSIDDREAAKAKLIEIGAPAVAKVREQLESSDGEVRACAQQVLKRLEESGVASQPVGDVLRMGRTVLHGWLDAETLDVETKYGTFAVDVRGIASVNLEEEPKEAPGRVFRLVSGESVQGDPKDGVLELETEFGTLKLPLKDVVSMTYDKAKQLWSAKTEKVSATGTVGAKAITIETPLGAIAIPMTSLAEIGTVKDPATVDILWTCAGCQTSKTQKAADPAPMCPSCGQAMTK